jgi:hypothetical protein
MARVSRFFFNKKNANENRMNYSDGLYQRLLSSHANSITFLMIMFALFCMYVGHTTQSANQQTTCQKNHLPYTQNNIE